MNWPLEGQDEGRPRPSCCDEVSRQTERKGGGLPGAGGGALTEGGRYEVLWGPPSAGRSLGFIASWMRSN